MTALKISSNRNLSLRSLKIGLLAFVFVGLASRSLPGQASTRTLVRIGHLLDVTRGAVVYKQEIAKP